MEAASYSAHLELNNLVHRRFQWSSERWTPQMFPMLLHFLIVGPRLVGISLIDGHVFQILSAIDQSDRPRLFLQNC